MVGLNRRGHLGAVAPCHVCRRWICGTPNARLDRLSHIDLYAGSAGLGKKTMTEERCT